MDKITGFAERLCANSDSFVLNDDQIVVRVGECERHQSVKLSRKKDEYVLTSVVLGAAKVRHTHKGWRELAMLVWRRNAVNEVVTFAFDSRDRLVGQVRHPAEHLDFEELELYVHALSRECDRFEYLLTGRDDY